MKVKNIEKKIKNTNKLITSVAVKCFFSPQFVQTNFINN